MLAAGDGEAEADVDGDATRAGTLEMYFPVAAHRAAWTGDENVLVATAERDGDAPVAYDLAGRRIVLSPDAPPSTPVLAVEPAELDFDAPRDVVAAKCTEETCGGGGGGYVLPPTPGLYMTKAEFVESFESWLKGDPEYEIHIMGPAAKGDNTNLVSFQCIGEHAPSPYSWDLEPEDLDREPAPVLEGADRCHGPGPQETCPSRSWPTRTMTPHARSRPTPTGPASSSPPSG